MDNKNKITEGVIWKQLLYFFFPILIGTFFQQLYNTTDAIIVGNYVGKLALQSILMHYGQNEAFVTTCQQISVVLNELGHHQEAKLFDTKAKQAMQHLQMQSMSGIEISKQYYLYYVRFKI